MRATRAVATSGLFIAFVCGVGWPAGAQVPPPEVSPEVLSAGAQVPQPEVSPFALSDVPPTPKGEDPFPFFDNYSWRSFIALNWPAMTGAANRGRPDRTKSFGDPGPRVWTTWKSRYEIFQPGGAEPSPWASYAGQNPCGVGVNFANDVVTLSSFSAFHDFNQADFDLHELGGPLVAQNRTYARYEVRVNQRSSTRSSATNGTSPATCRRQRPPFHSTPGPPKSRPHGAFSPTRTPRRSVAAITSCRTRRYSMSLLASVNRRTSRWSACISSPRHPTGRSGSGPLLSRWTTCRGKPLSRSLRPACRFRSTMGGRRRRSIRKICRRRSRRLLRRTPIPSPCRWCASRRSCRRPWP
jgi:hypothetical protein